MEEVNPNPIENKNLTKFQNNDLPVIRQFYHLPKHFGNIGELIFLSCNYKGIARKPLKHNREVSSEHSFRNQTTNSAVTFHLNSLCVDFR